MTSRKLFQRFFSAGVRATDRKILLARLIDLKEKQGISFSQLAEKLSCNKVSSSALLVRSSKILIEGLAGIIASWSTIM